jgi:hypothetical protein
MCTWWLPFWSSSPTARRKAIHHTVFIFSGEGSGLWEPQGQFLKHVEVFRSLAFLYSETLGPKHLVARPFLRRETAGLMTIEGMMTS